MHFVTGGAFNGKRAWVKRVYGVKEIGNWISAYENCPLPKNVIEMNQDLLILEGIEVWLRSLTETYHVNECREIWNMYLDQWLRWEHNKSKRNLVLIGVDITKGIVPFDKANRLWRDVTGWAYQDILSKSEKVDIIWYGINQPLKKGKIQ